MTLLLLTRGSKFLNLSSVCPLARGIFGGTRSVLRNGILYRNNIFQASVPLASNINMNFLSPRSFSTTDYRLTASKKTKKPKSHVSLWVAERLAGVGVLILFPLAFIHPHEAIESAIAILAVAHSHWGFEAIAGDYVRPEVVGNILPKIAHVTIYAMSILTLAGLFQLIFNGDGLAETIKMFWRIEENESY